MLFSGRLVIFFWKFKTKTIPKKFPPFKVPFFPLISPKMFPTGGKWVRYIKIYLSSSLSLSLSFSTSFFLNELSLSLFHSQACFILNVFLHMAIKHKYVETFRTRPFKGTHSSPFEIHKYVLTFTKGIKAHIKYTFRVCNPKWLALRSIMSYWVKAF